MHNDIWSRRRALRAAAAAASSIWLPSKAQDGDEIRIGQSAHLSGPLAPTLAMALRGQSLALDEINRSGGIGGR
ncbi:MAG TPA: ABC transporter substrate-binding protein, partial [Albitalea sp.]|nr:ABC transporter substrate-binding protein [Albitalea sp.]